jgi:hypothetical protein
MNSEWDTRDVKSFLYNPHYEVHTCTNKSGTKFKSHYFILCVIGRNTMEYIDRKRNVCAAFRTLLDSANDSVGDANDYCIYKLYWNEQYIKPFVTYRHERAILSTQEQFLFEKENCVSIDGQRMCDLYGNGCVFRSYLI